MIVDTDVLIWYMRGYDKTAATLDALGSFAISVVTYMELIQGMKNKTELRALEKELSRRSVTTIQVSEEISLRALVFMKDFSLSHSMAMADALIAASAITLGETLLTANTKHCSFIPGLTLKQYRP